MTSALSPDLDERIDEREQLGPGDVAHYVLNHQDQVTWGYIEQNVLEALCGYRWVPSKDAKSKPVCQQCKAIYDDNEAIVLANPRHNPDA